jgi:two-component system, cell cycle sensor histidine kinase PleC
MTAATNLSDTLPSAGPASVALTPDRAARLELAQLRLAEKNNLPGAFAMPVFALTLCVMLAAWVPVEYLAYWFVAMCASSARHWLGYQFLSLKNIPARELRRWGYGLAGASFAANLVWMFPAYALYWWCTDTGHMLLALVAGCSLAAGVALAAPSRLHLLSAVPLYALSLIVPPIIIGDPFHWGLAVLATGLSLFMAHLAYTLNGNARDLFMTREDKNDLIEQLAAAKIESDKARRRAEAASQAKSEFLANMSHELRTPLNAILGFSEIMQGEVFGPLGSPQYVEYAGHINGSGQHLLGLINDVLDLARIEAGRFVIRPTEIDLKAAGAGALKLFELKAAQTKITLKLDVEPQLPLLMADERAMRQLLLNLVSNAVKFTPAGGTVTIFAKRSALGGLDLGVSDTGVGIDPADLDTVFEAFGQGQHDVAARDKGTGLGLPIVRGLVEAHGGKVRLDSTLGLGTTVTCYFPRERLTAPQPMPMKFAAVV